MFLVICFLTFVSTSAVPIYITPVKGCPGPCIGDMSQPYDHLWAALQNFSSVSYDVELILLNIPGHDHYLFLREEKTLNSLTYYVNVPLITLNTNVTIKPLFCDEIDPGLISILSDKCISKSQQLTVYLKSEGFKLVTSKRLTIQNIIFDGIEDITKVNTGVATSTQYSCTTRRKRCCYPGLTNSNVTTTLKCAQSTTITYSSTANAMFTVQKASSRAELNFINTTFQYITFKALRGLIKVTSADKIYLKSIAVKTSVFSEGILSYGTTTSSWNDIDFTIDDIEIAQYNYYNISLTSPNGALMTLPPENSIANFTIRNGIFRDFWLTDNSYLIYSPTPYTAQIDNTVFSNILLSPKSKGVAYLFNISSSSSLTIANSQFTRVVIKDNARLIGLNSSSLTLDFCEFTHNTHSFASSSKIPSRIILSINNSTLSLTNTFFQSNTFGTFTNAQKIMEFEGSTVTVKNVTFKSNTFTYPGHLFSVGIGSSIKMTETLFDTNTLSDTKSQIVFVNILNGALPSTITSTIFNGNTMTGNTTLVQAAASLDMSNVVFSSNTFVSHSYKSICITMYSKAQGTLSDITFVGNILDKQDYLYYY